MRSVLEAGCYRVEADARRESTNNVYLRGARVRPDDREKKHQTRREICGFFQDLEAVDLGDAEAKLQGVAASPAETVCEGPVIYSYAASRAQAGYVSVARCRVPGEHRAEYFSRSVRIVAPREGFVSVLYVEDDDDPSIVVTITRWLSALAFAAAEDARSAAKLHTAHLLEDDQPPDVGAGPAVWTA